MKNAIRSNSLQYEAFMLGLCVFALVNVAVDSFFKLGADVRTILRWADAAVCVVFFADFLWSLYRASNRRAYFLSWGWIDLLSSVPMVDGFRIGRVVRIWRFVRILRGARATRLIAAFVLERRAQGAVFAVTLLGLLLSVFASIAVLQFEHGPTANIKGPADALWWAATTLTTVGYGDRFPVTTGGRVVGTALMAAGVGLVGTASGLIAAWFLAPVSGKQEGEIELLRSEIAHLREEVRAVLVSRDAVQTRLD